MPFVSKDLISKVLVNVLFLRTTISGGADGTGDAPTLALIGTIVSSLVVNAKYRVDMGFQRLLPTGSDRGGSENRAVFVEHISFGVRRDRETVIEDPDLFYNNNKKLLL